MAARECGVRSGGYAFLSRLPDDGRVSRAGGEAARRCLRFCCLDCLGVRDSGRMVWPARCAPADLAALSSVRSAYWTQNPQPAQPPCCLAWGGIRAHAATHTVARIAGERDLA